MKVDESANHEQRQKGCIIHLNVFDGSGVADAIDNSAAELNKFLCTLRHKVCRSGRSVFTTNGADVWLWPERLCRRHNLTRIGPTSRRGRRQRRLAAVKSVVVGGEGGRRVVVVLPQQHNTAVFIKGFVKIPPVLADQIRQRVHLVIGQLQRLPIRLLQTFI